MTAHAYPSDLVGELLDFIGEHDGLTSHQIAAHFPTQASYIRRVLLARLLQAGHIRVDGFGPKARNGAALRRYVLSQPEERGVGAHQEQRRQRLVEQARQYGPFGMLIVQATTHAEH